jgi:hypothetical protein
MRFASLAVAALLVAAPAAAQDPPPPLPPADVPPDPPPTDPHPPAAPPATPAVVEPPPAEAPARHDDTRSLKGHAFRPPLLLDTAFATTHVGLTASIGREVTPGVHVLSTNSLGVMQDLTYDATLTVLGGRVQAGAAFLGRIELDVDASYAGLVVGDQHTAVLFGGQSTYDVRPGLRIAALRSPSSGTALGVHAYGAFTGSSRLNPARVLSQIGKDIQAIAADPKRTSCLQVGDLACALGDDFDVFAAMKVSRATYGAGAAVSLAQAFFSRFGVQATAGVEIAKGSSSSQAAPSLGSLPIDVYVGVAPSLDLAPAVPIGISAEYRFDFASESFSGSPGGDSSTKTTKHGVAAGLYYTGRRDLVLGAAFVGNFTATSADGSALPSTSLLSGVVTMRYFF